ncbi:MAG: hypothetical protein B6U76_06615 [Desulfurococcales archaeon ex4484_217_2]|nr:MAG: hypothetical protein B6U76_06615 [Desulfurococcales archaeon ex4484_217_2]
MEVDLIQLLTTNGLAVAIAIYLVWWITNRLDRKLDDLTNAIKELSNAINTLKILVSKNEEIEK